MAVTSTTRLGITRWSAGTDPFTRAQMDASHAQLEALVTLYGIGTFAARPAAAAANAGTFYYVNSGANIGQYYFSDGATWQPVSPAKTFRTPHTFAVPGDVLVPSGSTSVIPGFFVPMPTGQTATLAAVRAVIGSGTSATFNVTRNGTAITGAGTGIVATPTAATTALGTALTADDILALTVTAVSGTPRNMSVSLYVDYTV